MNLKVDSLTEELVLKELTQKGHSCISLIKFHVGHALQAGSESLSNQTRDKN